MGMVRGRWFARSSVLLSLWAGTFGCRRVVSEPTGDVPLAGDAGLTRAGVLGAFGACAYDLSRDFRARAETFERRTATLAAAPSGENLAVARAAWEDAIDVWQRIELYQFGPAAPVTSPGGKDLRAQIYSWPTVSRCPLEQGLVNRTFEQPTFTTDSPTNRGLYAAEYLLFYPGTDNACGAGSAINTSGAWAALGTAGLAQRKGEYAHAIALDLVSRARTLETAWAPSGGNFGKELVNAGSATGLFASQQLAFNTVSDALFYIEIATKDMKLGKPSGLRMCDTPTCPEALESPWAKRSKIHVRSNLVGAQMLVLGCAAGGNVGFDDLLSAMGRGDVAARLATAFTEAIAAVDAIPDADLDATLARDPVVVQSLYLAFKKITDIIRTDFVTVLDLEIPKVVEGDND
jgi:predicted lipoprotein